MGRVTKLGQLDLHLWENPHEIDIDYLKEEEFFDDFTDRIINEGWQLVKARRIHGSEVEVNDNEIVYMEVREFKRKPHLFLQALMVVKEGKGATLYWNISIEPSLGKKLTYMTIMIVTLTVFLRIMLPLSSGIPEYFMITGILINFFYLIVVLFGYNNYLERSNRIPEAFLTIYIKYSFQGKRKFY